MGFAKNSSFIAHELNSRTAFFLVQFTKDICLGFKLPVQPSSPLASTHMLQNMHLDSSRLTSNYAVIILINSKEQVPFCKTKFWATLRFSRRTLLDGINENYLIINSCLKKFLFNAIRSFVTAFKAACHLSLSWARSIHISRPITLMSVSILYCHPRPGLLSSLFTLGFPTKTLYVFPFSHAQARLFLLN